MRLRRPRRPAAPPPPSAPDTPPAAVPPAAGAGTASSAPRSRRWLGRPSRRRLVRGGLVATAACLAVLVAATAWIRVGAAGRVHDLDAAPVAPVAIVLGAQVNHDGVPSAFLAARLDIAAALYARRKVSAVLVSGDHGQWSYDEPGAMAHRLTALGVPVSRIVQDHAGFDTYDSCQRAYRVFGVREAVVVTQSFHIARAVTLCAEAGIRTTGVGDDTARAHALQWRRGVVREYGAAVKAALDVLADRDPVFLGPADRSLDAATRPS